MATTNTTDQAVPATSNAPDPAGSRVYIIGAGIISRDHAAAAAGLQEIGVLSVADPDPGAREAFQKEFPQTRMFEDAHTMLAEPAEPDDIVVVATPHALHLAHVVAAFRSGRHVLCEKPLAMNMDEADEMLAEANRAGRLLGCCSVRFLGLPATEEAKRAVDGGDLGTPYHATFVNRQQRARAGIEISGTAHWFLDRSRAGGGTLMAWSPYDITTLNHVLDPIRVEVRAAWMSNPTTAVALPVDTIFDTEQHIGASLRYHRRDGDVIDVTFERAACTHGEERTIVEVEGSHGAVAWDWIDWLGDGDVTMTRDDHGKAVSVSRTLGLGGTRLSGRPLAYFRDRIAGRPSLAVVNEQAIFNFACLEAIYACVEFWPTPDSRAPERGMTSRVYAMDVSFYHSLGAYDFDARCEMLAQLGYDGVTLTLWSEDAWADVPKLAGVSERHGLEVVSVLVFADISGPPDHVGNRRIVDLCESMTGCATIEICLWASDASFTPRARGSRPSDAADDDAAIAWLRHLLPIAERRGITLCLYPHVGFWLERIEDAVRLCGALDHPNLRMAFNGWHWYTADGTDLESRMAEAAPYLALATLSGTRRLGSREPTIEPLDDGELDNFAVLGALKAAGYAGPIGVMGYSVGGDVYAKLARSLRALREMEGRLAEHPDWARLRPLGSRMVTPRAEPTER